VARELAPSPPKLNDNNNSHRKSPDPMSHAAAADQEPRRSVRATKGQHTKAFDQLETTSEPVPKRRGRKKKQEEEPEEEVIRCVCGATDQDDDSDEAWIACDKCGVWQHNVCMGMSRFAEDLPKHYYCEQHDPSFHKELLEQMARGEEPWIERRRKYEEEKAAEGEKKKRGKKGKGKRVSEPKSEEAPASNGTAAPSPTPEVKKEKDKERKEPTARQSTGKRKSREESHEKDVKVNCLLPTHV
jgi:hypothetical protein